MGLKKTQAPEPLAKLEPPFQLGPAVEEAVV